MISLLHFLLLSTLYSDWLHTFSVTILTIIHRVYCHCPISHEFASSIIASNMPASGFSLNGILAYLMQRTLREKCPYSELFLSVFSLIPIDCGPEYLRVRNFLRSGIFFLVSALKYVGILISGFGKLSSSRGSSQAFPKAPQTIYSLKLNTIFGYFW